MEQYAGPRVTVKLEPNGQYQAFHDNFRSDDRPHEHWQTDEWTGWTWFELVSNSFVAPDEGATEEELASALQSITDAPSIVDENEPAGGSGAILTDRQVFRGASYLFGPAVDRGPPEPSIRKRVVQELSNGVILDDINHVIHCL